MRADVVDAQRRTCQILVVELQNTRHFDLRIDERLGTHTARVDDRHRHALADIAQLEHEIAVAHGCPAPHAGGHDALRLTQTRARELRSE